MIYREGQRVEVATLSDGPNPFKIWREATIVSRIVNDDVTNTPRYRVQVSIVGYLTGSVLDVFTEDRIRPLAPPGGRTDGGDSLNEPD